jgi:Sigma-70 region 2
MSDLRELHVHCYRMTSSLDEADELVQETMLRAWRHRETYQGRASGPDACSTRTVLHRIVGRGPAVAICKFSQGDGGNYARGYSQRSATLGSTAAARRAGR